LTKARYWEQEDLKTAPDCSPKSGFPAAQNRYFKAYCMILGSLEVFI